MNPTMEEWKSGEMTGNARRRSLTAPEFDCGLQRRLGDLRSDEVARPGAESNETRFPANRPQQCFRLHHG